MTQAPYEVISLNLRILLFYDNNLTNEPNKLIYAQDDQVRLWTPTETAVAKKFLLFLSCTDTGHFNVRRLDWPFDLGARRTFQRTGNITLISLCSLFLCRLNSELTASCLVLWTFSSPCARCVSERIPASEISSSSSVLCLVTVFKRSQAWSWQRDFPKSTAMRRSLELSLSLSLTMDVWQYSR